jgi:hypothetical protein
MKRRFYSLFTLLAITAILFSCSEDAQPPVVQVFAEVNADDPYTIDFTTTTENVTSYAWEFGDGETSTEANPSHTYAMSGDYTAKVTVTGEGGTAVATKDITIAASIGELLSGGPSATNGKTWVLDTKVQPTDGAGLINDKINNVVPLQDNILYGFGLEAEYDNEFTFKYDGSYSVNPVNGSVLAGVIYAEVGAAKGWHTITHVPTSYDIMMAGISYTPESGATWEYKKGDLTVTVRDDQDPMFSGSSPDPREVTFIDADYFEIKGSFFGVKDFTQHIIIRDITSDQMTLSILFHTNPPSYPQFMEHPSVMVTITYKTK